MSQPFRVLLVEDDFDLAETIAEAFEAVGWSVEQAWDGRTGLDRVSRGVFDLLVLDLGLPDLDGLQVLRSLRQAGHTLPVLILTARGALDDRLAGFEEGADDYLPKPFELSELIARLRALLRRSRSEWEREPLRWRDLELTPATREVRRAGQPIKLTRTGYEILHLLMRRAPAVVDRDALTTHLWGDYLPSSDALRSHVYQLRRAIDRPFSEPLLETLVGVGFRLRQS